MTIEKILIPPQEAAQMLSISESTLWLYAKQGRLPAPIYLARKMPRWRVADLQRIGEPGDTVQAGQ